MQASTLSVAAAVRTVARERADSPAITFEGKTTTYGELHARSNAVAHALLQRLTPQSRVAFLNFNSPTYFETFLGAAKARCALVAVNARLAAPEVAWILNDSQTRVLFVGREHYAMIESLEDHLKDIEYVALDGDHPRWPAYEDWRDACDHSDPAVELQDDDDIVQLYTSGTTGHPKGVCHTNRTWSAAAQALLATGWSIFRPDSINLVCLPLFHVAGFNSSCHSLFSGAHVVLTRRIDPLEILERLQSDSITDTLLVPTVIHAVVNVARERNIKPRHLRTLSYGAAPIAQDLVTQARALFECNFLHLYGMTENLGTSTYLPPELHDPALGKLRSCGRAYPGLELRVVDESGLELPPHSVGEIIVRSPWIMRGYWRGPEATREAVRDGWLWSGDAGYLDEDGFLYIQDRIKDMIKSGGENVYPAEVESALFGHPAIADVAVVGVPDDHWGEVVKAFVVMKPGVALDIDDVLRHARERIAGFKLPRHFEVIGELPRNASGKVLRRQLRGASRTAE